MTALADVVVRRPRVRPGADGDVRRHIASVAAELTSRRGDVTLAMRDELALRVHELDGDPVLLELLAASIEGNVVNILRALQHGIDNDRQEPPTAAVEYARRLAQRGVPVNALVRAYRLGQQFLLRLAFDASRRLREDEAVRADAYDRIVNSVFDYIDWISQRVVVVYEEEREAWLANRSNALTSKVLEVVEGASLDVAATEKVIGYRLSGHHVAVVAWMHESAVQNDQLSRTSRVIRQFASEVGGGSPLVMGCDRATAWGWVPVPRGWSFQERLTSWRPGEAPAPVLALGSSRGGLDGFRASHKEALRVHRIASFGGIPHRSVVSHDEPGIAATGLLSQNLASARAWMRSVLGELLRDDENTARLRKTVLTLLRHEMSYTATAETMVMHKNSIKYRLASAEEILGRPVTESRLDVELALTACEWLGPAVLSPVDD